MEDKNIAPASAEKDYILEVDGLKQHFPIQKTLMGKVVRSLRAVDGVSFKLETNAIATARSTAGSSMRRPPTTFRYASRFEK